MKDTRTLYELLGVRREATATEIRTGYRLELEALEALRVTLPKQDFDDRVQLLRVAYTTLNDPISRAGYDADLDAAAAYGSGALATIGGPSSGTRADALGLRADALALRADALMARADIGAASARPDGLFSDWPPGMARLLGYALLVALLIGVSMGVSRCSTKSARAQIEAREAQERRASEQAALQDYYQTHGVRPANRAEMEMMEAERRRRENQERQSSVDNQRAEEQQRRIDEENRRRGDETTREVQRAMAEQAEEQQRLKFEAEQLALEISMTNNDYERKRLKFRLKQIKERMSTP